MDDKNEIILYQPDNSLRLEVRLEDETVWLSQTQMAELFGRERTVISKHIRNIFSEGELDRKMVCANFAHTTPHGAISGKTQSAIYIAYNLDVIISVGYRVKSRQGTLFRQWATRVLKDYLMRGYAVNRRIENIEHRVAETERKIDFLNQIYFTGYGVKRRRRVTMITVGETGGRKSLFYQAPEGRHAKKQSAHSNSFRKFNPCGVVNVNSAVPPVSRSVPSRFTDGYHCLTPLGLFYFYSYKQNTNGKDF
ncbi:MAG: virulence RhuM family protein [Kiritimatiellaeota bacterium]|nr:virulence RhuM family protein [Kiritimatiellota bacterium]